MCIRDRLAKYETIKEAKRVEMRERNGNAKLYLTEALKEATIYVNEMCIRDSPLLALCEIHSGCTSFPAGIKKRRYFLPQRG